LLKREKNNESILVIVSFLGAALNSCRYSTSKVCALSILRHIGKEIKNANIILNHLLPYFISCMEDDSTSVQVEAAEGGMELLGAIEIPILLNPTDFKIFQLYILPAYRKMGSNNKSYVRASFMKVLGKICEIGKRFIEQGIMNQTNYFNKLAATEHAADSENKTRRRASVDFINTSERTISNLDNEIEEMGNSLMSIILDITANTPQIHQSAMVQNLSQVAALLGPKKFETIASLVISMLNIKTPQLLQSIFEVVPSISLAIGIAWIQGPLSFSDEYMKGTEELVIYSIIECCIDLIRKKLLPKTIMLDLYERFASLLAHPNEWIRNSAIDYCKAAADSLSDAEVFSKIRPQLQGFVKNFVLVTHEDPFQEFLIPPLSRIILDLVEAGIPGELNQTPADEYARVMFEKQLKLSDLKMKDSSELRKKAYDLYNNTTSSSYLTRPDCVGKSEALKPLLQAQEQSGMLTSEFKKSIAHLRDDFEIYEKEADDYIDQYFTEHKISNPTSFFMDNNGQNPPSAYENFVESQKTLCKWRHIYKNESLCKALKFYAQNCAFDQLKDKQGKYFSFTATKLWRQWRPFGRLMSTLNAHKSPVYSISVSDDTTFMATGSSDGVCCIWNALKLRETLAMPIAEKIQVKGKITTLKFLENTHSIAIGTDTGEISLYKLDSQSNVNPARKSKDIITENEGGIIDTCTYLTSEGQNILVYITQKGGIHVHDVRVKKDVNVFNMGCEHGLISSFCMGRDENNYYAGTVGGYIAGYDLRFNLITSLKKYTRGTPICDMCTYLPEKITKPTGVTLGSKDGPTPLLFVASGGETPQIDLCHVDKDSTEWSFVVGNPKLLYRAYTPYNLQKEELNYTDINQVILKKLTKGFAVSKDDLKTENVDQNTTSCHFAFKDFYGKMKTMYNSNSRIYKMLCPRITRNEESAPFLLTAGADRVIRYWHLGNLSAPDVMKVNAPEMTRLSCIVSSPDDREVEYMAEDFNEKVLYEHTIRGKTGSVIRETSWQNQNGVSYLRVNPSKIPCAGHTDAILNMSLLELPFGTYLATCGRDNMIKIWS